MKKILLLIIVSLMFSTNVYAKKAKGGAGKGGFSAKSAPAQTNKSLAPAANKSAPVANAAAPAANAPAQNPSLLQSAMPALVGGAVGSYIGSKLASDGEADSAMAKEEKKEDHPLTTR